MTKVAMLTTLHAPPAATPMMTPRGSPSWPEFGSDSDGGGGGGGGGGSDGSDGSDGDGSDGGDCSDGGGGGGGGVGGDCSDGGGMTIITVGIDNTVTLRTVEAAAAVPRLEESVVCTAAGVVEAGTAMLAVMSTLAAATVTVTAEALTPTTAAIELCSEVVSE